MQGRKVQRKFKRKNKLDQGKGRGNEKKRQLMAISLVEVKKCLPFQKIPSSVVLNCMMN